MRKKIVIANWKMSLSLKESVTLANQIQNELLKMPDKLDVVFCPSYTAISSIGPSLSNIKLGGQDCCWEEKGPFTGEVSAAMLKEMGCEYVIIGHSERRVHCLETDEMINKKIKAALKHMLTPILCLGETQKQREQYMSEAVILDQLKNCLLDIQLIGNQQLVIAYEPIWAIGSGHPVGHDEPDRMNKMIRHSLLDFFPPDVVKNRVRTIYGGSVKAGNVSGFMDQGTEDGVLVGTASLDVQEFVQIVKKAAIWT